MALEFLDPEAAFNDLNGHRISVNEIFLKYDGPMVFLTKIGFENYLMFKVEIGDQEIYLAASSVTDEVLDLLRSNKLSILGALRSGDFIVLRTGVDITIDTYWRMDITDFDQELLPDPGLPVDLGIEGVADTVAQAKSYFSIKLSGGMLDSYTMSFHQFKKMIDNAYSAVRNLLAPNEFRDSKSQIFDFRITEPQFGSLIINIDRPDLPSLDASKRILNDEGVSNQAVGQYFNNTRELTLRRLDELQRTVHEADVQDRDLVRHLSLIRDLSRLFPDKNDLHEDIELSGEVNGERKVFVFNAANTKKLSEAYSRLMEMPRDASGEISIINNGSFTVVINPENMKPLTCKFSKEDFSFMAQSASFKTGAVLSVHGVIQERKQRHLMFCDRPGILPDDPH